jgi:flagellar biosynthesis protein FlhB
MSFLEEIKNEYKNSEGIPDEIKDSIKEQIQEAAREGKTQRLVKINTESYKVYEESLTFIRELGFYAIPTMTYHIEVSGWS